MPTRIRPDIGQWYTQHGRGALFQVVAIDEDSGTIEIQDADGDVDEIEPNNWRTGDFREAAPPEEWMEPAGERDRDDGGLTDHLPLSLEHLGNPLEDSLDTDEMD